MRIELGISRSSKEENKFIFDFLHSNKAKVEESFGEPLEWLRFDNEKSCRVQFSCKADGFNTEHWAEWVDWHLTHMTKLEKNIQSAFTAGRKRLEKRKY